MGEIFVNHTHGKRLMSKMYKEHTQLNSKKEIAQLKKLGKMLK